MASDEINDEYVAKLLKKDAEIAVKKYEFVGLEAFHEKSSRAGAPKPNTRFLQHIIRQTDSHNAALLAKEAEESRARLAKMNHGDNAGRRHRHDNERRVRYSDRRSDRLTPYLSDDDEQDRKRRRIEDSDDDRRHHTRHRRDHKHERREHRPRRDGDRERKKRRDARSDDDERSRRESERSKRHRDSDRRHRHGHGRRERRRERSRSREEHKRSYSRSRSRTRSATPPSRSHHKSSKYRSRSRSPKRSANDQDKALGGKRSSSRNKDSHRSAPSPLSDSGSLDDLIGPLPPGSKNIVRSRGRGAHKANSMAMDARFSSTYDASTDVRVDSDIEDEWGDSLETLRDRQLWKAKGADRLREAGFSDEVINKWENGKIKVERQGEKGEEDVVWASKGQHREWDRGKVVDADGNVDTKAEWGRLK